MLLLHTMLCRAFHWEMQVVPLVVCRRLTR
jgi:hypothetical protein